MSVIHFPEKYKQSLMDGFNKASETDALFTHELDTEFSGVNTVHVTSLKTEPLQDYNRNLTVGNGSRYGTTKEVGDEVQTFTMTQDKSLSLSIDKGNNAEQSNMKQAGKVMKAHRDEQIIPAVDTYRLRKWAEEGGIHKELSEAPGKTNIVTQIIELHNEMLDAGVPDNITLLIARTYLPALKLSSEWTALDSLGGKTLPKGTIGEFDGMAVKPMTSKRMPANVPFMLIYKGSVIAPMKIEKFKGHVDPPGLSGDLLEFRMIHDAFVLGKKANGVAVAVLKGYVATAPTITVSDGKATITATGSTAVYYTTDGSDPRYSKEAKAYTAAVSVVSGDVVRAYATAANKYSSAVSEKTVE
jgi:hypothetical protein